MFESGDLMPNKAEGLCQVPTRGVAQRSNLLRQDYDLPVAFGHRLVEAGDLPVALGHGLAEAGDLPVAFGHCQVEAGSVLL
ncbi:MAG: hypothetical protein ABT00_12895 [Bordetella sp. SCN 68-11]|nr:MAG: hypothetical protein ABT00_12895 [Bordetella sp. SCN 68-11]